MKIPGFWIGCRIDCVEKSGDDKIFSSAGSENTGDDGEFYGDWALNSGDRFTNHKNYGERNCGAKLMIGD